MRRSWNLLLVASAIACGGVSPETRTVHGEAVDGSTERTGLSLEWRFSPSPEVKDSITRLVSERNSFSTAPDSGAIGLLYEFRPRQYLLVSFLQRATATSPRAMAVFHLELGSSAASAPWVVGSENLDEFSTIQVRDVDADSLNDVTYCWYSPTDSLHTRGRGWRAVTLDDGHWVPLDEFPEAGQACE
jgi:hypothetical protein